MNQTRKWFTLLCLLLTSSLAWAQDITVKGTVVDQMNEPLIGVTVVIDGVKSGGTVTDFDGKYTIKAPTKGTLKFSYIGYQDQKIDVAGKTTINVTMQEDNAMLQEVVVVGFGTVKKESLTGAVATVDAKAFEGKGSLASPLEALQGQVAGVMITRTSSAPGEEGWDMKLRGSVSKNSGGPLVIIDGVAGDINSINSSDIESINFLKDGSAAIYGSRAADGVVIITTKKGKEGRVKVNYSGSVTVKATGLQPETMSLGEWADGLMQTLENDQNTSNVWYTYAQLAKQYQGRYIDLTKSANPFGTAAFTDVADFVFSDVDWLGGLFGNAVNQEHNLSVSGGSDKNSYRLSLGYNYDGSNLRYGNNSNKRFNFRLNDTYKFTKNLSLQSSIGYFRRENVAPTMISAALTTTLPQPGLSMATLDGKPYAWGTWGSPVAKVEEGGDKTTSVSRIDIIETLNYDITPWLTANVNLGYNTSDKMVDEVQNPITYYNITGERTTLTDPVQAKSYYTQSTQRIDNYSFSAYINGHKTFWKDHNFSLTLGTQYEFKEAREYFVTAYDILEGLEVVNGSGDVVLTDASKHKASKYQNSILSYFGRFNYDYLGRYLLEFNGRYDGSSKFLPENRWDFFWGLSAGWRINEEKFLKDAKWLTNLKLRASYAEVGNQSGIGNYDGVQLYSLNSNNGAYLGNGLVSTITTSGTFASNTRSWERIKNYNLAIDFGVTVAHGHSINGTVEYFQKRNNNMLVSVTLPATLGDAAPSANKGKFKDYGWEGQLTYNGKIGQVDIHAGGTFTFARNELTEYEGTTVKSAGYTSNMVGYGINSLFGLRFAGKIQNEEQLAAYKALYFENNGIGMPSNLRVGDNMYCDENHDGKLDENDLIYLGSSDPEISYSFNVGASWKGIDLNIVFQGAANRFIYRGNVTNWTVPYRNNYTNNLRNSIGNVWTAENPNAYYAPYTNDGNINLYNYQASTLTAQDGRYLRLKNITVGYTFPKKLLQSLRFIDSLRIYYTGADLWETTKINDGWDPESKIATSGTSLYPFTRNHTFGLNVTF
jgi:TonB-linked SusC/RagA family outer membrane protein